MALIPSFDLCRMIQDKDLLIEPFEYRGESTPPASVDLHVKSKTIRYDFPDGRYLLGDEIDEDEGLVEEFKGDHYDLEPGTAAVFVVHERIVLPDFVAGIILPRSSLTRLGVSFQPTFLNPGYQGNCPVLLVNHSRFSIRIPFRNGVSPRVAQVLFFTLISRAHRPYGEGRDEKYQHEEGSVARFDKDFDILQLIEPFKRALDKI